MCKGEINPGKTNGRDFKLGFSKAVTAYSRVNSLACSVTEAPPIQPSPSSNCCAAQDLVWVWAEPLFVSSPPASATGRVWWERFSPSRPRTQRQEALLKGPSCSSVQLQTRLATDSALQAFASKWVGRGLEEPPRPPGVGQGGSRPLEWMATAGPWGAACS